MVLMDIRTSADAARIIKTARLNRELSQQSVADAVGMSRQALARIERGQGGASFEAYLRIFSFLDIPLSAEHEKLPARGPSDEAHRASSTMFKSLAHGLALFSDRIDQTLASPTETTETTEATETPSEPGYEPAARAEARRQRLLQALKSIEKPGEEGKAGEEDGLTEEDRPGGARA